MHILLQQNWIGLRVFELESSDATSQMVFDEAVGGVADLNFLAKYVTHFGELKRLEVHLERATFKRTLACHHSVVKVRGIVVSP